MSARAFCRWLALTIGLSVLPGSFLPVAAVEPQIITDFSGGLNTWQSPLVIADNETPSSENVIFDESGALTRRKGYSKINSAAIGGGITGVNAVYGLEASNGTRYCVAFSSTTGYYSTNSCQTFTAFVSTLTRGNDVNCDPFQDRLYCVNDQYNFFFDGTNDIAVSAMPAALDYIRVHRNRCFVAGATGNLSRLYYSNLGNCSAWTTATDFIDIAPEDGDVITGIGLPIFDMIPIYKKFSTWALKGATPATWVLINVSKTIGAKNHRTIDNFNNVQLFDSIGPHGGKPGIYAFNGIVVTEASAKLRNEIDVLDTVSASDQKHDIDNKTDWDKGTFDSRAMSSSRDSGFMQSSFTTLTDTLGADFGAFTSSDSISTNAVTGSLTLAIASGTFVGGGFQNASTGACATVLTASDWTIVSGDWRAGGGLIATCQTAELVGPLDGTEAASDQRGVHSACTGTTDGPTVEILDENNNVLLSDGPYTSQAVRRLSLVSLTHRLIKVQVSAGSQKLRSKTFVRPNELVHAVNRTGVNYSNALCDAGATHAIVADFVEGVLYTSSGAFTSRTFDTTISTPVWGTFTVTMTSATERAVTFKVQSATSSSGVYETAVSQSMTVPIGAANRRYLRYQADFTTTVTTKTAEIASVVMNAASTGTWQSEEFFTSDNMSGWGLFQVDQTVTGSEASIAYAIKASTYSGGTAFATFTVVTDGATPAIATGAYVVILTTVTVGVATETAKIDVITVNWNEGAAAGSPSAKVFDGRYHYGAQSSGGTENDVMYVLDSKGAWSKWTGVQPGHLNVINNNFVMAGSTTTSGGFLFNLYDTDSDNGTAINAFWESKDFALNGIHKKKAVSRIFTVHSGDDSTVDMTLKADGGLTSKSYSLNFSTGAAFGIKQTVVYPSINGHTFRLRYENNAASKPWEVLGAFFYYTDLGLMP